MTFASSFLVLLLSIAACLSSSHQIASPRPKQASSKNENHASPYPITIIHQFPPRTWVENLAVWPNGLLLAITLTSLTLYQLNPRSLPSLAVPLYDFPAAGNVIQGITEVQDDVFTIEVATCNLTALSCTPVSFNVWKADLRRCQKADGAKVRKVADIPAAVGLNGEVLFRVC